MAKQMKVKKLKNLKTLDSKPGECLFGACSVCDLYLQMNVQIHHLGELLAHPVYHPCVLQVCTLHINHT